MGLGFGKKKTHTHTHDIHVGYGWIWSKRIEGAWFDFLRWRRWQKEYNLQPLDLSVSCHDDIIQKIWQNQQQQFQRFPERSEHTTVGWFCSSYLLVSDLLQLEKNWFWRPGSWEMPHNSIMLWNEFVLVGRNLLIPIQLNVAAWGADLANKPLQISPKCRRVGCCFSRPSLDPRHRGGSPQEAQQTIKPCTCRVVENTFVFPEILLPRTERSRNTHPSQLLTPQKSSNFFGKKMWFREEANHRREIAEKVTEHKDKFISKSKEHNVSSHRACQTFQQALVGLTRRE